MTLIDVFTTAFIVAGISFFLAGSIGLLRFPNVYSRLHALTKIDNVGLGLIVIGLLPQLDRSTEIVQVILIWALTMVSGAAGAFLLARKIRSGEQHQ